MSERDFLDELSLLMNKKQQLESEIAAAYKEMDSVYLKLKQQFEQHYLYFKTMGFFDYDIVSIDFYLGEVALAYDGSNYSLSNRLFEFNNKISNIEAFDLTPSQLLDTFNILTVLYKDISGCESDSIIRDGCTINDIIDGIKILTEDFSKRVEASEDLKKAIQKLYVLLDYTLYDNEDKRYIRELRSQFINLEIAAYDKISRCESLIDKVEAEIEVLSAPRNIASNSIENNGGEEALNQNIITSVNKTSHESSVKRKSTIKAIPLSLVGALGVHFAFGITRLLVNLVVLLLSYIPIVNILVKWMFRIREDTPDMLAISVGVTVAYLVFQVIVERVIKIEQTRNFTLIFTGMLLMIFNILFVIVNLICRDAVFANVLLSILGIVIFFKGKNGSEHN